MGTPICTLSSLWEAENVQIGVLIERGAGGWSGGRRAERDGGYASAKAVQRASSSITAKVWESPVVKVPS